MTTEEYETIEAWIKETIEELQDREITNEDEQRSILLRSYHDALEDEVERMSTDKGFWAEVEAMIEEYFED